jgi:hypothetical protein
MRRDIFTYLLIWSHLEWAQNLSVVIPGYVQPRSMSVGCAIDLWQTLEGFVQDIRRYGLMTKQALYEPNLHTHLAKRPLH